MLIRYLISTIADQINDKLYKLLCLELIRRIIKSDLYANISV